MPNETRRPLTARRSSRSVAGVLAAVAVAVPLAACGSSTTGSDVARKNAGTPSPTAAPTSTNPRATAMTSGFVVERDGFSFENYGNDKTPTNLTTAAMESLFGADTCARVTADGCVLTAPGAAWLAINNAAMDGGHCFGMAAAAALFYTGAVKPEAYGAGSVYGIKDGAKIQELIARLFVTQSTEPETTSARTVTVREAIASIRKDWAENRLALLAIRTRDKTAGHAVTPIAFRDLGNGKTGLVVYDNNFPGKDRVITLDPAADTWSYVTATDPSAPSMTFAGDSANPLQLFTTRPTLDRQECPFCRDNDSPYVYVVLNPDSASAGVTLSVTDLNGNSLAGVSKAPWLSDDGGSEDVLLRVPSGAPFKVVMTGTKVAAGSQAPGQVTVVGAGWTDSVTAVQMSSGESDSITVTDPKSGAFSYTSADAESPILGNTVDEGGISYSFQFKGARLDADGGTYEVSTDQAKHVERIASVGTGPSTMQFVFERIDGSRTQVFRTDKLTIDSGEALLAGYGAWKGDGSRLDVGVASTGSDTIRRRVQLLDQ